jgi:hypothetical protein
MNDPYIPEDEEQLGRTRFSVSVSTETHGDLKNVAKFWNAYAELQGKPRSRKWKVTTVMEQMLKVALRDFWKRLDVDVSETTVEGRKSRLDDVLLEGKRGRRPKQE